MRTVGEVLKNKRLEKKLSLDEVEKATKIRAKYLDALEENNFGQICGGAAITKGFIKNYADYLGLSSTELLAIFRRDFHENKDGQILPHGYYEPLNQSKLSWNPRLTFVSVIALLLFILGFYLFHQVSSYLGEPKLKITQPEEGSVLAVAQTNVLGASDSDAAVYVNGEVVSVDKEGKFETKVSLFPGENKIKVEAISRNGKKTELLRRVERESF